MIQSIQISTPDKKQSQIKAGIGAVAGTAIPLAVMLKKRKTNLLKIDYSLKDMLILSSTSIAGGTAGGIIGQDKIVKKQKVEEAIFQFLNAAVPGVLVGAGLKLCEKSEKTNNRAYKAVATAAGLIGGMIGAAKVSNLIIDPKDKHPDRKITFKDGVANLDDVVGALTLAKFPLIQKLHVDKFLPAIYTYCGFRAGNDTPTLNANKT